MTMLTYLLIVLLVWPVSVFVSIYLILAAKIKGEGTAPDPDEIYTGG